METVSVKFEETFLNTIEKVMQKNHYATKAEFIREAIRDKVSYLKKQEQLMRLKKFYGASKRRTTDEELHLAGERAFEEIEKRSR